MKQKKLTKLQGGEKVLLRVARKRIPILDNFQCPLCSLGVELVAQVLVTCAGIYDEKCK